MLQLDNFYKARFVLSKVIRKTELVHTPRINWDCLKILIPQFQSLQLVFCCHKACR